MRKENRYIPTTPKETGIRPGEAWALRWKGGDFEKPSVTITPEKGSNARQSELLSNRSSCSMRPLSFMRAARAVFLVNVYSNVNGHQDLRSFLGWLERGNHTYSRAGAHSRDCSRTSPIHTPDHYSVMCGSRAYQPQRTYADTPRDFSSIHTLLRTTNDHGLFQSFETNARIIVAATRFPACAKPTPRIRSIFEDPFR